MAAEGGDADAQRELGHTYEFGTFGLEVDLNEALKWR
jgi:TPR repeat protein